MAAYMRGRFPFLGLAAPQLDAVLREAWAGLPPPTESELRDAVLALWALPEREFQYAACGLLTRWVRSPKRTAAVSPQFLAGTVQHLLTAKSWWDTVDALRGAAVGPLVQAHPALRTLIMRWIDDDDRWLVRSAIIHQLGYRERTDADLLFALCARRAGDREFFIAKAIGWALRTHAARQPEAVRDFVAGHPELTALARREALKHLR